MGTDKKSSAFKKSFKIIDSHFHIGKYASSFVNTAYEKKQLEAVIALNYSKIVFAHNSFFFDLEKGLKNTLDYLKKNIGFAFAFTVYNPHMAEQSINIITRHCFKNNIVGVKIHPEDHQCYITDPAYEKLWRLAVEKNIPILSHTWNPDVASRTQKFADALLFEQVIKKHPGLNVILGHAGAKDYYYYRVIKMLKNNMDKNIYIDIAGDIFYRGMIELFVKEVGSERILFGSDSPWTDPLLTVLNVLGAKITDSDRQNIFYNNAARLFNF